MKRLGIFAYYNENGIIEDYVRYLLNSFDEIFNECIILVNGKLNEDEIADYSKKYKIIFRKNIGYNFGAFKEFFMNAGDLSKWDEIVLFNATFYGPFFSWNIIFDRMDKVDVDFWGLSKHLEKRAKSDKELDIKEHIQSYFIAIRRAMFMSQTFYDFWKNEIYASDFMEAVKQEIRFTPYFKESGFCYSTWLDIQPCRDFDCFTGIVYEEHSYELLVKCQYPILKYKTVNIFNFIETKQALDYIENHTNYDVNLILNHIKKNEKNPRFAPFTLKELSQFIKSHRRIYIFGHGRYGSNLAALFSYYGWNFEKFIVTSPQDDRELALESFKPEDMDGLVVAIGKRAMSEVEKKISQIWDKEQVLFPRT